MDPNQDWQARQARAYQQWLAEAQADRLKTILTFTWLVAAVAIALLKPLTTPHTVKVLGYFLTLSGTFLALAASRSMLAPSSEPVAMEYHGRPRPFRVSREEQQETLLRIQAIGATVLLLGVIVSATADLNTIEVLLGGLVTLLVTGLGLITWLVFPFLIGHRRVAPPSDDG